MTTKYPDITVQLSGQDGNGFFIVVRVGNALKMAGVSQSDITVFRNEATSGDYDHLLQTCMKWVNVE